jgi:glycosyltransferase involved in cell wall biosynthesis
MARILVIASYTPSLVLFRGDLLRTLVDLGHEVTCCSPDPDDGTLGRLDAWGVAHRAFRLQRAGMNPVADMATIRDLRGIMASVRPDHVLAYTIKPVIYGCLAAGRQKVPAIHAMITGLGTTFMGQGVRAALVQAYVRFMYRAALKECRTVFFQNTDDRAVFAEYGLVTPGQAIMINGSGINLERFPCCPVPDGEPVFLLVARLVHEKGVADFARAARLVKARYPGARFQVAGFFDDHPRAIGRDEMAAWTADGVIEYLGPTDDVRPLMRQCAAYCLPSYREGTPRTVLEAMATGRAIITTDTPGCRETVDDGINGLLVPVRDPAALAAAMLRLCEDRNLLLEMGRRSRELAAKKFDVVQVNAVITHAMGLTASDQTADAPAVPD